MNADEENTLRYTMGVKTQALGRLSNANREFVYLKDFCTNRSAHSYRSVILKHFTKSLV